MKAERDYLINRSQTPAVEDRQSSKGGGGPTLQPGDNKYVDAFSIYGIFNFDDDDDDEGRWYPAAMTVE